MSSFFDVVWEKGKGWTDRWGSSKTVGGVDPTSADQTISDPFEFDSGDKSLQRSEGSCRVSSDCASGFACMGSECVKVDASSQGGGGAAAGNSSVSAGSNCGVLTPAGNTPTAPCGGPTGGSPGSYTCTKPGCGGTGESGGGAGNGNECCGTTYTRCTAGGCLSQCVPFENTVNQPNEFCSEYFRANGSYGPGCNANNTCSECSDYDPFTRSCVPRTDPGAPCYCGGGCPAGLTCEKDPSSPDFGKCVTGNAVRECGCTYTCPCGKTLQTTYRQPLLGEGPGAQLACPTACRQFLAKACDDFCPDEPKDACAASPSNPCLINCSCQTRSADCGEPKPPKSAFLPLFANPDLYSSTNLGYASNCFGVTEPTEGLRQTWIEKICEKKQTPECKCARDGAQVQPCPNGQRCDVDGSGQCEDDPAFDNVCESNVVCGGRCCSIGATCVQACSWTVNDVCHGQGFTFIAPCSPRPILTVTARIPASGAVCGRYHTHCSVQYTNNSHLDCQAGLINNGPTGGTTCG